MSNTQSVHMAVTAAKLRTRNRWKCAKMVRELLGCGDSNCFSIGGFLTSVCVDHNNVHAVIKSLAIDPKGEYRACSTTLLYYIMYTAKFKTISSL